MGAAFSSVFDKLFNAKLDRKMLVLGLDNAGKTTILYKLQLGEVVDTTPTIGFNCETLEYRNVRMTCWDVGGQKKLRKLWRHYYQNTAGLIYVVDSADNGADRMEDVKEELHAMLQEDGLRDAKVLILANKQDMRGALRPMEVAERLGMGKHREHEWYVQGCCGTTGDGLHEGLDWMVSAMNKKK